MTGIIPKAINIFICMFFLMTNTMAQRLGIFENENDVGAVLHPGSLAYDQQSEKYTLSGSGANIWLANDEFHYAWKKMKGNFIVQCRANFSGKGTDPHRKLGWMVRSSLHTDAPCVNATIHGDGLTSLQFRKEANTNMQELKFDIKAPDMIQLERRGKNFIMSVAHYGEPYVIEKISDVDVGDEVYVGLFICSHNKDVIETATFNNVRIIVPAKENFVAYKDYIGSTIEIFDLSSGNRKKVYTAPASLQAPNWTPDGKSLLYNSNGLIYKLDLGKKILQQLNTGNVRNNNNDHVISFNGKMLGLSSSSPDGKYNSVVYTVPVSGGSPKQITPIGPSYLHGWSPDGKYLIYTGQRNNEFDIYKIPATGGDEIRLTTTPGLDDGSEFSPDGKYIYFNSVQSGTMQIWRMKPDGSDKTQLTSDEYNNWFPHVSPDGKWIVFLSFMKDVKPDDHPFYKHVYLRMMPISGGQAKVIVYLYGGQGSINTPSWSPDSKRFAFVSNSE
ncbi:MAG: biopolymer transporter TolR [Chitinophagaceae bacterium]|nr:biopolymer transporter TolR [Chitinophagaceae bacterium]